MPREPDDSSAQNRSAQNRSAQNPAAQNPAAQNPLAQNPAPRDTVPAPSFGNMSAQHWSRARAGTNEEALEYYRERSRAPGVKAGGAERNHYCMRCDGVIPHDPGLTCCPHCGESLSGAVKRYFNWVEINEPPPSDLRALLPMFVGGLLLLAAAAALLWWWIA